MCSRNSRCEIQDIIQGFWLTALWEISWWIRLVSPVCKTLV